jgi:hypothetical protein
MDYRYQRLYVAVLNLATGTQKLQDRLHNAHTCALSTLNVSEFPHALQTEYKQILVRFETAASSGDGDVAKAATSAMSDAAAQELAENILRFFCRTLDLAATDIITSKLRSNRDKRERVVEGLLTSRIC